jgi:hypothetical protein
MVIKIIFILCLFLSTLYCSEKINNISSTFKQSKINNLDEIIDTRIPLIEDRSFFGFISKEIYSSVEAKKKSKIYPSNLDKSKEIKKIEYKKNIQYYSGTLDYIDSVIDKEFTNYLSLVIIIQFLVILLFIILYIDMNLKIKKMQLKKDKKISPDIENIEVNNNLREVLL